MAISYPPIIEGDLGAFYDNKITIPFTMNKAVGKNEVKTFKIRIKNLSSNTLVLENTQANWNKEKSEVTFISLTGLTPLAHYKIQIAYVGQDDVVSPYSTVGIAKYTYKPNVTVIANNNNPRSITGQYNTRDASEKLYSSYFTITDTSNNLFFQSEEVIHNTFNDSDENTSIEKLNLLKVLQFGKNYYVQFHIKTINEIELSSAPVIVRAQEELPIITNFKLQADLNFDQGYVNLYLTSGQNNLNKKYMLARADSKDNFNTWTELLDFEFSNTPFPIVLWQDFTVEQGVSYQYAIYQYNDNNFYGKKITLDYPIYVDFEDMFLYDGERQLKIRYNPKISSFKKVIMETKQDTIGSQYPFIFRNGHVDYKEFPISGIITYLEDEADLFLNKSKFIKDREMEVLMQYNPQSIIFPQSVNLTGENIHNERLFKLEVLEWLTNGKPKLFRSPSEGNYLVRLLNTSLSPLSDGINRMIHTFNSTAYEIEENSIKKLKEAGFINTSFKLPPQELTHSTFRFAGQGIGENIIDNIDGKKAYSAVFNVVPLGAGDSGLRTISINNKEIQVYDNYRINNIEITELSRPETTVFSSSDSVTIGYYPNLNPIVPEDINTIDVIDVPCYQAFGKGINTDGNLLSIFQTINRYISHIYEFKISTPPISILYKINDEYFDDIAGERVATPLPYLIYKIIEVNGSAFSQKGYFYKPYKTADFIAVNSSNPNSFPEFKCQYIDTDGLSETIRLNATGESVYIQAQPLSIYATPGVVIEIAGRTGVYNYAAVDFNYTLQNAQDDYNNSVDEFINYTPSEEDTDTSKSAVIDPTTGQPITETVFNEDTGLWEEIEITEDQNIFEQIIYRGLNLAIRLGNAIYDFLT